MSNPTPEATHDGVYDWSWFRRGMGAARTIPALILVTAFVGFGGLAREAGITLPQLLFMVPTIWALPSHLLVVAGLTSGASILATALAVSLAAIRMMPMTMALVPVLRTKGSRTWHMVAASNFVAITGWVHTLRVAPDMPRPGRLPYFCGFAVTLIVLVTIASAVTHQVSASFPPSVMAPLYFLTPLYFMCTMWTTAKVSAEKLALGAGLVLGPAFAFVVPQANILLAGVFGGLLAYLAHRYRRRGGP